MTLLEIAKERKLRILKEREEQSFSVFSGKAIGLKTRLTTAEMSESDVEKTVEEIRALIKDWEGFLHTCLPDGFIYKNGNMTEQACFIHDLLKGDDNDK